MAPVITTRERNNKLLDNKTIDGLYALKLPAMAAGLAEQRDQAPYQALSFEERLGLLVDKELTEREDRRVGRYLKSAKLRTGAVTEDIDFHRQRGLERSMVLGLAASGWVKAHHNLAIVGPTGAGKTFLACALANSAVRHGAPPFTCVPPGCWTSWPSPGPTNVSRPARHLGPHRRPGRR